MDDFEETEFALAARLSVRESQTHEALLRIQVDIHDEDTDSDVPNLATLSNALLAEEQKRGVVASHSFYMMRDPIWVENPDVAYQAGEFDAINSLLPAMALAIEDTRRNIFATNEVLIPGLALGEEEHFWHHPAFATEDMLKLIFAALGRVFSNHEPILVVQAIARGNSNHQRLAAQSLFGKFLPHDVYEGGSLRQTYYSMDVLEEYQLAFLSPGQHQDAQTLVPFIPEQVKDTEAVFPFLPPDRKTAG